MHPMVSLPASSPSWYTRFYREENSPVPIRVEETISSDPGNDFDQAPAVGKVVSMRIREILVDNP